MDDLYDRSNRADARHALADDAVSASGATRRAVARAADELRRGSAVLIDGPAPLLILAADTADREELARASAVAGGDRPSTLLMPSGRLALLRDGALPPGTTAGAATAVPLDAPLDRLPVGIGGVATGRAGIGVSAIARSEPPPPGADVAIALAKRARLIPVLLAAVPAPGVADRARDADLVAVDAAAASALLLGPADPTPPLRIVAEAPVPLIDSADTRLVAFRAPDGGPEHIAIVVGDPGVAAAPLVRLHSECFTGDLLGSLRCDCGDQLRGAIRAVAEAGAGAVLYLAQEGRGIGLANKLRAYGLQDRGLDTLDANRALGWDGDERGFGLAASMLAALGLRRIRLLTNNPDKLAALRAAGIEIAERVPLPVQANDANAAYLDTKRRRFGHFA